MESLFSLILVGKAKVFVICIVKVKLSIVLYLKVGVALPKT